MALPKSLIQRGLTWKIPQTNKRWSSSSIPDLILSSVETVNVFIECNVNWAWVLKCERMRYHSICENWCLWMCFHASDVAVCLWTTEAAKLVGSWNHVLLCSCKTWWCCVVHADWCFGSWDNQEADADRTQFSTITRHTLLRQQYSLILQLHKAEMSSCKLHKTHKQHT